MKDKLKICLICALIALITGPLVLILTAGGRTTRILGGIIVAEMIVAVVTAGIYFGISFYTAGKSRTVKILCNAALGVVSFIALLSVFLILIAPGLLYYPRFDEEAYEYITEEFDPESARFEPVEAGDLAGWRIKASDIPQSQKRPVILFFGGNGMESSSYMRYMTEHEDVYREMLRVNDFVFFDYPEYGQSEGDLSAQGMRDAAVTAYEAVRALPTTSSVIAMGYSIGTGPACYLASVEDVDGLILLAPYKNGTDLFNGSLNIFHGPMKLLVSFRMDSDRYAADCTCPVLIMASDRDETIPYDSSRELFLCFNGSAVDFITIEGISHNDFPDNETVFGNICEFAAEVG